jgi:NAD(P)-dependent dehydrogenase (short-subunit alcohol dehydrogenase family)
MTSLNDAVVLVTGANGGLGTEFVTQALDRGASRVYATARTPRTWDDPRVTPLALDVDDPESIAHAVELGRDVTILVNNAGITVRGGILDATDEDVRRIFDTNVFGPLALARAFVPTLRRNGNAAIVDVHSALSWYAAGGIYSASKAALWSITNSLRLELAPKGVQVVGAHLGYTDTPMTASLDVRKERADDIVRAIWDGVESGAHEVLADDASRAIRAALSGPLEALYPELSPARA